MRRRLLKRAAALLGAIAATALLRYFPELGISENDLAETITQALVLAGGFLVSLEARAPKDEDE